MDRFTEVTAENLRYVRGARGLTQEAIAEMLGIPVSAVSNIEKKKRSLADTEKKLLDLFFFGVLPEGFVRTAQDVQDTLDFTEQEWSVVQTLANRAGQTPAEWVKAQIRSYLAYLDQAGTSPLRLAADEAAEYGKKIPAAGTMSADTTPPPYPPEKKKPA